MYFTSLRDRRAQVVHTDLDWKASHCGCFIDGIGGSRIYCKTCHVVWGKSQTGLGKIKISFLSPFLLVFCLFLLHFDFGMGFCWSSLGAGLPRLCWTNKETATLSTSNLLLPQIKKMGLMRKEWNWDTSHFEPKTCFAVGEKKSDDMQPKQTRAINVKL